MNRTDIIDAVVTRTKRPDLQDEIWLNIQQATLTAHNKDFFKRDLAEVPLVYNPTIIKGQIIVDSVLPAFRKICYIRKYDPDTQTLGSFLTEVEPDKQIDYWNRAKADVYYIGGKVVNWQASTEEKAHIVGYWRFPDVSKEKYDSWIADMYPFCIIERAVSKIFRTIGQEDQARSLQQDIMEADSLVQINEVVSQGR